KKSSSLVKSTPRPTPRLSTWKTIPPPPGNVPPAGNFTVFTQKIQLFQFGGCHLLSVRNPCPEHPAIHPPPGQQLERFARTQGRAAGGVQVTMDRGEEQAHGIPGGKAVKRCLDQAGSARNEPVAIALMPSRRDHFPETPARVGQS